MFLPTKRIPVFAALLVAVLFCSCAARLPSSKTAQSTAQAFFKRYGKKYPGTRFSANVARVSVNQIEAVSHKIAYVDTNVEHSDGATTRTLIKMENKFPGGWHVISWEILNPESQNTAPPENPYGL